ncbi:hypothetical protein [Mucilaginibacter paludis]|uniref:FG-GAP repeat-containing protein n=1 Tax=Mucilaginibacter paludis DSM 18603 TaxID=714943 RepID=H1XZJ3_9SPHI|nr:hypothetical protein [Mucilaginibacter paludis]EHQ26637.1 FG-GAP repeat-containing protein [Mucilaginibacter paludis DSM 18603]
MKYFMFLIFVLLFFDAKGQCCLHTDLSRKFDYKVIRLDHKDADGFARESKIIIELYKKSDKKLFQKIQFKTEGIGLSNVFSKCSDDRSYITGQNMKTEILDGDYGDIVIADFNFDGKEDFAIKYNIPADVGPEYCYFIQGDKGFKKDEYLSNQMLWFPWLINSKKHQLISIVSPNWGTRIYKFQYNVFSKKWRKIGNRFFRHDEGLDEELIRLKNI